MSSFQPLACNVQTGVVSFFFYFKNVQMPHIFFSEFDIQTEVLLLKMYLYLSMQDLLNGDFLVYMKYGPSKYSFVKSILVLLGNKIHKMQGEAKWTYPFFQNEKKYILPMCLRE